MILSFLPSTDKVTFDEFAGAGARDTPQVGAKALFHRPIEPMVHVDFVLSVQIHPLGRKYAAC